MFPPLLQTILLVWQHSGYYQQLQNFFYLLEMVSNEVNFHIFFISTFSTLIFKVVVRARTLVDQDPFEDPLKSYKDLKDALRLCAAFRGTYLDFKVFNHHYIIKY